MRDRLLEVIKISCLSQKALGLDDLAGTQACGADGQSLDTAIDNRADALQIGLEFALGVFDHVHTDTALLLGQTATGDVTAGGLVLAANLANCSHDYYLSKCFAVDLKEIENQWWDGRDSNP